MIADHKLANDVLTDPTGHGEFNLGHNYVEDYVKCSNAIVFPAMAFFHKSGSFKEINKILKVACLQDILSSRWHLCLGFPLGGNTDAVQRELASIQKNELQRSSCSGRAGCA